MFLLRYLTVWFSVVCLIKGSAAYTATYWRDECSLTAWSHFAGCDVCVCVCVAGLDADLLAVIPAFSRHSSLKHLMLGKNFNIKGR